MKTPFRFLHILFPLAFVLIGSLALMGLWNWLMPSLFGLGTLTFLQALGILVLMRILTWGGFGWHRWRGYGWAMAGGPHYYHPYSQRHAYWRSRMKERWEAMTPEEKEKWKSRCGSPFWEETPPKDEPAKA